MQEEKYSLVLPGNFKESAERILLNCNIIASGDANFSPGQTLVTTVITTHHHSRKMTTPKNVTLRHFTLDDHLQL
jgi:hypothetical protein